MNEVIEKRTAVDVADDLDTKLRDINVFLDIMTTFAGEECDINGAAFAIQRLVEDADKLAKELYSAGGAS